MLKALRGAAVVFGIASLTFTNSMCNQLSGAHTRGPPATARPMQTRLPPPLQGSTGRK